MIDGRPDRGGTPTPSQKLILPAPHATYSPPNQHTQRGHILEEHLMNSKRLPIPGMPPLPTHKRNWRKDPAFIVLLAAICAVLIGGIAFAAIASNMFSPSTTQNATPVHTLLQSTPNIPPTAPTTSGVPANQPTQAITPTVQPSPAPVPITPTVQPTATQPTQGQNGPLTIQVANVPTQVLNNTIIPISVTTSNPNTAVRLVVEYNVPPFFYKSGIQTTDANGNATLSWPAAVHFFGRSKTPIVAHLVVTAKDQNNQQAVSQTFSVRILIHSIVPE